MPLCSTDDDFNSNWTRAAGRRTELMATPPPVASRTALQDGSEDCSAACPTWDSFTSFECYSFNCRKEQHDQQQTLTAWSNVINWLETRHFGCSFNAGAPTLTGPGVDDHWGFWNLSDSAWEWIFCFVRWNACVRSWVEPRMELPCWHQWNWWALTQSSLPLPI